MSATDDCGAFDPAARPPDHVFDGGDLDCGSGLVLLLREHVQRVPEGGVLEVRSREPTVGDDLPPWCRLVGHEYLGRASDGATARYFLRRGGGAAARAEAAALARDKEQARDYEWRTRIRATGPLRATAYARNFSFVVGQPASFEEKDAHPSALEYVLGALGAELAVAFRDACGREGLELDDVELTVRGKLHNVLAHLGLEAGDPSIRRIEVKCFVSTTAEERRLRAVWEEVLARSPLLATFRRGTEVDLRLSLV